MHRVPYCPSAVSRAITVACTPAPRGCGLLYICAGIDEYSEMSKLFYDPARVT